MLGLVRLLLTSEPLAPLYTSAAAGVGDEAFADPTKGLALPFSEDFWVLQTLCDAVC